MKKLCLFTIISCLFAVIGCKTLPTVDKMYITSYAVGAASAKVIDITNVSDKTVAAVITILNSTQTYVPSTNETFSAKWPVIVDQRINTLVEKSEISDADAKFVKAAFVTMCKGLDYIVDVRYPSAKQYNDLMSSAIYGFSSGFTTYFNNSYVLKSSVTPNSLDGKEFTQAYRYLTK